MFSVRAATRSFLLLVALAVMSGSAHAQSSASLALAEIREQILYANYDAAITAARTFLERTDLDAQSRAIGLEVLATAHIAKRDQAAAEETLRELYRRDPGHRLTDGDASPLVQAAFQRARERLPETIAVRLLHERPVLVRRESPEVQVTVAEGMEAVQEVRIAYRTGGAPRFANLVLNLDGTTAVGRLPLVGAPSEGQRIEYFVIALAPSGAPLAQLGDEAQPLVLDVPAERAETTPLGPQTGPGEVEESSSKWWVGVLVGLVVVAAGGVALAFLLGEDAPSGSLGSVSLQLR